jgi:hypothetical protein
LSTELELQDKYLIQWIRLKELFEGYNCEIRQFGAKKMHVSNHFLEVSIPLIRIWNFAFVLSVIIYFIFAQTYLSRITWFWENVGSNYKYQEKIFHSNSLMSRGEKPSKTQVLSFVTGCIYIPNIYNFYHNPND